MVTIKKADKDTRNWQILQMKAAWSRIMLSPLTSCHDSRSGEVRSWLAEHVAAFFDANNRRFLRVDPDDEIQMLRISFHLRPQLQIIRILSFAISLLAYLEEFDPQRTVVVWAPVRNPEMTEYMENSFLISLVSDLCLSLLQGYMVVDSLWYHRARLGRHIPRVLGVLEEP